MTKNPSECFRPFPGLRNAHLQTLLGTWLRPHAAPRSELREIFTEDGEPLWCWESVPATSPSSVTVIVHGLTGGSSSASVRSLAAMLFRNGIIVLRMNQRGCGPGSPITRGLAHAGRAGDLAVVLADLQERWPSLPIDVVGISFGGHLALSLACSELPEATLPRCIVAVSPPLHLARASERISTALGGLYRRHFVAALIAEAERRARCFGEALPRLDPAGSVRDFDARYTAPRSGFASVDDYYTRCSTLERLGHVRIPTQIWSAQDDPLVPFEDLTRHRANQNLTEWRIAGGGHLGFLGRPWNGGFHWWERQVLRHLSRRPSASDEPEDRAIVPAPSRNGR